MKVRKSKRQSAWEFMRRNPTFCAEDAMLITDMGMQNMRQLMGQLKQANIAKCISKHSVPFEEKVFRVLDAKSIICPVKSLPKTKRKNK